MLMYVLATAVAAAQTNGPPGGWSPFFRGGSVYHGDAGLNGGIGEFSVHRYYGEGGLAYLFRRDRMVSCSVGYGQDDYRFSGLPQDPWNNIDNIRAGIFSRWALDSAWTFFAAASARAYGERVEDLTSALTGALFGGASYRFSERLSLGPGLGVVGQLEDNPRYFPILVIDWDITRDLNLSTGGGLAATGGPGLMLTYSLSRHWNIGLGGRYDKKRFLLSEQGIAPNGVGEDRSIPLISSVSYILYPGTELSLLVGVNLNGRLTAEDANGTMLYESEYDQAVFSGITARIRL